MTYFELPKTDPALFSWETSHLDKISDLSCLEIRTIFQEVPPGQEATVLGQLEGYQVYLLTGDPYMELAEMKETIDRSEKGFAGVMFDIEPYGRQEWKQEGDNGALLQAFCEDLENAYSYAKEREVEMFLCIPYWYDDLGYESELERMIQNCDGFCVMNYWKGKEKEHIRDEYKLAGTYARKLWTAYEFGKADGVGILPQNTYAEEGIEAAFKNYRKVFQKTGISPAYHDLAAILQII
ncbi:MAG: hypothetical protein IK078_11880 [Lachnospiraceae bacterium]|nr:hypothetical protein [Lachnospiraceae bacterium]